MAEIVLTNNQNSRRDKGRNQRSEGGREMSIIIQNISAESAPMTGPNRYRVRINQTVICEFEHDRQHNGLAQCLRDAADAVEAGRNRRVAEMLRDTSPHQRTKAEGS